MERAFDGESWVGCSVLEMLDRVSAKRAAARPIPGAHTIWEIVLHLSATQEVMLGRMQGIARELSPEEDWPPMPEATETAWREAVDTMRRRDERLRDMVAAFDDGRLDERLVPGGTSSYNNLHGYIQHTFYHLGQIGLLEIATRD
jgi:uncharacterized damage-inducible protein DinB